MATLMPTSLLPGAYCSVAIMPYARIPNRRALIIHLHRCNTPGVKHAAQYQVRSITGNGAHQKRGMGRNIFQTTGCT